jgi:hypothetical protein
LRRSDPLSSIPTFPVRASLIPASENEQRTRLHVALSWTRVVIRRLLSDFVWFRATHGCGRSVGSPFTARSRPPGTRRGRRTMSCCD